MKTFIHAFKLLLAFSLLALAAGCASSSKGTQDLAIAAGFKVITPVNPEQKALLQTLPEGKITQITHDGKLYYVLPDAPNNQAYVGGPNEYQVYQQMRVAKQISDNNLAGRPDEPDERHELGHVGRLGWRRRLPLLMGWLRARGSPGPGRFCADLEGCPACGAEAGL
jgi:hypothetical protein